MGIGSLKKSQAKVPSFPGTIVAVMVGVNDPNNPWIDASAFSFFQKITARSKTFDRPNAPHNVLHTQAGADLVLQRMREIVAAGRSLGRPGYIRAG